jgi:uncharacterized protein YegL
MEHEQNTTPLGEARRRPAQFIILADKSGSMKNDKIQKLNQAIREAIPLLRERMAKEPTAVLLMRSIMFSTTANWHQGVPTPIEEYQWSDLTAEGTTSMGAAFELAADAVSLDKMDSRGFPPVYLLVTDGDPTDDYKAGLKRLMAEPWGRRGIRMAIGIGDDVKLSVLQEFICHPERKPLHVTDVEELASAIVLSSTVAMEEALRPSGPEPLNQTNHITPLAQYDDAVGEDVW